MKSKQDRVPNRKSVHSWCPQDFSNWKDEPLRKSWWASK